MSIASATERLFFALWPDDVTRERCAALARGNAGPGDPVAAGNIHLTLVFLGATTPERRACACGAADQLRGREFVLTLDHLGYFPRPRVVWAGAGEVPAALSELVEGLVTGVRECGCEIDTRAFVPHVTLVRKARRAFVTTDIATISWRCQSFVLVKSDHSEGYPRYEVLRTWNLAPNGTW